MPTTTSPAPSTFSFPSPASTRSATPSSTDFRWTNSKIPPRTASLSRLNSNIEDRIKQDCSLVYTNSDLNGTANVEAGQLTPNVLALPCGTLAKFFPTDSFVSVSSQDGSKSYAVTAQGINFKQTRYDFSKYRDFAVTSNGTANTTKPLSNWTDLTQDRFSIWMVP